MDAERTGVNIPTGDPRVDQAIAGLSALGEMDLDDRPAVLGAVHDQLREILGELGDAPRSDPARPGEPGRRGEQGELGAAGAPRPGAPRPGGPGGGSWGRRPDA
jgi:hypothetical protein